MTPSDPSRDRDPFAALVRPATPRWEDTWGMVVEQCRRPVVRLLSIGVGLVLLAIAGGGWWLLQASHHPVDGGAAVSPWASSAQVTGTTALFSSPSTTAAPDVVVHAAGAVQRPGLYRLPAGSRVGDLLDAAGGATAEADVDRLNLAGLLADGARVYVPRAGEASPPSPIGADLGGSMGPSSSTASDGAGPGAGLVDVNTATADQLDALPGVGPSTAAAIIDYREEHGRFRSVDDLLQVRGIGPAKLEQLRAQVTV